jgi:ribosomal protein S27E
MTEQPIERTLRDKAIYPEFDEDKHPAEVDCLYCMDERIVEREAYGVIDCPICGNDENYE